MNTRKYRDQVDSYYPIAAFWWFVVAILVLIVGFNLAARYFPGGFDWAYTVVSALASQKHNPQGSLWFAGAFALSMVLLWPYVTSVKHHLSPLLSSKAGFAILALRSGMVSGIILGLERMIIRDLSSWVYKAHELLAVFAFLGFYIGTLTLLVQVMLRKRIYVVPVLLIFSPLAAIGITQLWLYLYQRDLGWVDVSWREMGIPLYLSFAFWQWIAIGFLGAGLALLSFIRTDKATE